MTQEKFIPTFSIDWLHCNEPYVPYALINPYFLHLKGYSRISPATPHHGYTEAFCNEAGCQVMRNPNRRDMGVHIAYSGRTLNTYRDNGVEPLDIVRRHLTRHATFSRIDLAFDLRNTPLDIRGMYDQLFDGRATTKAKSYNLLTGSDGGATLYIGSRQSECFLRVYDKGVESGEGGNWKRIELELKGSKAQFAAFTMAHSPNELAFKWAQGALKGYATFEDPTWTALCAADTILLSRANKPETDTRKWLIDQVAPAMAKYMNRTGDYKLLADFMAVLSALENKTDLP